MKMQNPDKMNCFRTPKATHIFVLFLLLLIVSIDPALNEASASTFKASPTGFEKVAKEMHDLLDGFLGTTIAIIGGGFAVAGLARGWNAGVVGGGMGTALAAAEGPDLILSLSGAGIV